MQVVALALKERMLFDMQHNVQVTRRPAERSRLAQPAETNARSVFHSRRNLGLHHALAQLAAFAFALGAWIGDHAASSLACGTCAGNAEEPLLIANLATPIARPAFRRSLARSRSRAAAAIAGFVTPYFDLLFDAKIRFFKFQVQVFAQVGAALGTAAAAAAAAEQIAKAEQVAKDVAEILENRRIEARRTRSAPAHARVSKAVVQRTLVAVSENGIGLRDLFELLFRVRIIGIAVGMVASSPACDTRS